MTDLSIEDLRAALGAFPPAYRNSIPVEEWVGAPSPTFDDAILLHCLDVAPFGPRLELGVYYGRTLRMIANHQGLTVGVDSFEGMADPGPRDLSPDGSLAYPKGALTSRMSEVLARVPEATLIRGWIPAVFDTWLASGPASGPYAFAHVDLDHYEPTLASISWLWDRMLPGGIICCDDWFPDRDHLAAGAINEWAMGHPFSFSLSRKAVWTR